MKTVAIIIARMGSTRLPGKVLMDLDGSPVISWVTRALKVARGIDHVIVATTTELADDAIEVWCRQNCYDFFRGSENDVLARVYGAAVETKADIIVRVTCDCPFIDPNVVAAVVRLRKETGVDYCSNVSPRTFPDGLDCEAFTFKALEAAHNEATRPIDRECVTTWIQRNQERFPSETVINWIGNKAHERWVLDTEDDLKFCREVAQLIVGTPSQIGILDVLDMNPEITRINETGVMNERYFEALAKEPIYPRTYDQSQEMFQYAKDLIPTASQTFSKSYLQFPQPSPLFLTHGDGALVWDVDGNEYVDLVGALLPNILGYRDPDVDAAIRSQLNRGISFSLSTRLEVDLAEALSGLIPCAEMAKFLKTGTEATTAAVRVARAYTGRDRVLICGGYHGWGSWSCERRVGITDREWQDTTRVPFGDIQKLHAVMSAMGRTFACAIVEPETNPEYLQALRKECDRTGTILIFDEIITWPRFGLAGAQGLYNVVPDLTTLGKGIANGMPLSAVVGRTEIMRCFVPPDNCFVSSTFGGETLSLAAAIATIDKIEREGIAEYLSTMGKFLDRSVGDLTAIHGLITVLDTTGYAPLVRLKFNDQPNATADQILALFRREMIASGVLIINCHAVSYAHGPNEVKRIIKAYDHTLSVIRDALDKGDIAERLGEAGVSQGVRA